MMVAGIVFVSFSGVALSLAGISVMEQGACARSGELDVGGSCDNSWFTKGALLSGLFLALPGIPLIVLGAQKVPVAQPTTATLTPWLTPTAAGLGVRFDM